MKEGSLKGVYDVPMMLCNDRPQKMSLVKDKDEKLLTTDEEVRRRWQNISTMI